MMSLRRTLRHAVMSSSARVAGLRVARVHVAPRPTLFMRTSEFMTRNRSLAVHWRGQAYAFEYTLGVISGHLSFALLAASYGFKDILELRVMAVAAGICMLSFNFWHPHGKPLWLPFKWNVLFIITNMAMIVQLLEEERKARSLTPQQIAVFEQVFEPAGLSRVDFVRLMADAEVVQVSEGTHLCYEGAVNRNVLLVIDGRAAVVIRGTKVYELSSGQFIGEMGIHVGLRLSNAMNASATVTAMEPTTCISWPRGTLIDVLEENDRIARAVQGAISADLIRKLTHTDHNEVLAEKSLHIRAEKQYSMLLERVLEKGHCTSHDRNMLKRYRIVHDINDKHHADSLGRIDWTVDQYEFGSRTGQPPPEPSAWVNKPAPIEPIQSEDACDIVQHLF